MTDRTIRLSALSLLLVQFALLAPGTASANPLPGGTLAPIALDDGGNVTGFFTLDATGTTLTGYSLTSSAFTAAGQGAFTYDGTDSTATFSLIQPGATASGPPVAVLNIFAPGFTPLAGRRNLEISFYDPGLAVGTSLGLCDVSAGACLTDGPLSTLIQSGEQYINASSTEFIRLVSTGSVDITDPPGGLAFNLDPTQTGCGANCSSGGGSGGGPTSVPEPSALLLFGVALCALAIRMRARLRAD